MRDPDTLALARRVDVVVDGNPNPNALVPVTVEIVLRDGRGATERVEVMYGHPARPMTRGAQLEKFRRNCEAAARPISPKRRSGSSRRWPGSSRSPTSAPSSTISFPATLPSPHPSRPPAESGLGQGWVEVESGRPRRG